MTSKHAESDLRVFKGKLEENTEEISSVALLNQACLSCFLQQINFQLEPVLSI